MKNNNDSSKKQRGGKKRTFGKGEGTILNLEEGGEEGTNEFRKRFTGICKRMEGERIRNEGERKRNEDERIRNEAELRGLAENIGQVGGTEILKEINQLLAKNSKLLDQAQGSKTEEDLECTQKLKSRVPYITLMGFFIGLSALLLTNIGKENKTGFEYACIGIVSIGLLFGLLVVIGCCDCCCKKKNNYTLKN